MTEQKVLASFRDSKYYEQYVEERKNLEFVAKLLVAKKWKRIVCGPKEKEIGCCWICDKIESPDKRYYWWTTEKTREIFLQPAIHTEPLCFNCAVKVTADALKNYYPQLEKAGIV